MRFQELPCGLDMVNILVTVREKDLHSGQRLRGPMTLRKSDEPLFPFITL